MSNILLIKTVIPKIYPEIKFDWKPVNAGMECSFWKKRVCIIIDETTTIIYLKKKFDEIISKYKNDNQCTICDKLLSTINRIIQCQNCKNEFCSACLYENGLANDGIVVCFFCKYRVGEKFNAIQMKKIFNEKTGRLTKNHINK